MAVYTEVAFTAAAVLLERLGLGKLTALEGIASGIENTNYFATTTSGRWVLTLFERLERAQLPYYLHLMQHLAEHGIPVPVPKADADARLLHELEGKPAAVVTRLTGSPRERPALPHLIQVGALLGRMHVAGASFAMQQPHLRGLDWWVRTAPEVLPHLGADSARLLRDELAFQRELAASPAGSALPRGPIHADLFRDNVLFDDDTGDADAAPRLSGVFDFYFAGTDALLFDLAVCLNDWCTDSANGRLDELRAAAFVAAYRRERGLHPNEARLLPAMLRAAALRFWLSRLWDLHLPRAAALLAAKDPAEFERVLRQRIATPWHP